MSRPSRSGTTIDVGARVVVALAVVWGGSACGAAPPPAEHATAARREPCAPQAEASLRDARAAHARVQAGEVEAAPSALALYEGYLRRCGGRPEAQEATFLAAQLQLYHLDLASEGAARFLAAWRADPQGALASESLRQALVALDRAWQHCERDAGTPGCAGPDARLDEASGALSSLPVADADRSDALLAALVLYLRRGERESAERLQETLMRDYPGSVQVAVGRETLEARSASR